MPRIGRGHFLGGPNLYAKVFRLSRVENTDIFCGRIGGGYRGHIKSPRKVTGLQMLPVETVQRSPIESGLEERSILMGYLNW